MKPSIAITLIICGTALILSPSLFDLVQRHLYMEAVRAAGPDGHLVPSMQFMATSFTGFFVYLMGAGMIGGTTHLSINWPASKRSQEFATSPQTQGT